MKLKLLKSLKTDVTGKTMSTFKPSKFSRSMRSDLFFSLKKEVKNKKIKRRSQNFRIKTLLARINPNSIGSGKRDLDFNSVNSKNVFLRTKRKSSYGQTLLEKQRLKKYLPRTNEKVIKKTFFVSQGKNNNNKKLSNSLWNNIPFVFSSSNIFVSSEHVRNKNVYEESFYRHEDYSIYSYKKGNGQQQQENVDGLKLVIIKNGKGNLRVFDRVLPSNIIQDLRLDKIKFLEDNYQAGKLFPFDFDIKKLTQHYRLKRG